ncbi:MAG: SGNH/GDSL hydrolase family protein [Niabella sp.]
MKIMVSKYVLLLCFLLSLTPVTMGQADPADYLSGIKEELQKKWPHNRTINLVFHGHSVPTGYFRTPDVRTLDAYPFLVLQQLKKMYPFAVINSITTSIGGENSVQGAKRFNKEVLTHRPDVLFIDYALNDRGIGLEASRKAMDKMIKTALKQKIKVILLTPSPDLSENIKDSGTVLNRFSLQLLELAKKYHIGLADSYNAFRTLALENNNIKDYMSQSNHPNRKGHEVIAGQILPFFEK